MTFLNEYEIRSAELRFDHPETPNLHRAAVSLLRLMEWTNANSDGWPYWPKPSRAAAKLQDLLQQADRFHPTDCSAVQVTRALSPVKAFLTRRGVDHSVILP